MKLWRILSVPSILLLFAVLGTAAAYASSPDSSWIKTAASANMLELKAGQLAQMRDTSPAWKRFAAMMARDHAGALSQIRALAVDKSVRLPGRLLPGDQRAYFMLSRLHGAAFDRAYRRFAVMSHVQANALYNAEITGGRDSDVRAVAAKQLPTVQSHLAMADKMTGTSTRNLGR